MVTPVMTTPVMTVPMTKTTPPAKTAVMNFDNTGSRRRSALQTGNAAYASSLSTRKGYSQDSEQRCSSCED